MENFASVGTMEEQHRHIGETNIVVIIPTVTIGLITITISLYVHARGIFSLDHQKLLE